MINHRVIIKTLDLISGPPGVAAVVQLPERLRNWYQLEDDAPHVFLMLARQFEPKDLGPMVRKAREV